MGLFKKANLEGAPAAAEVRFATNDTVSVAWHGAPEILVRGHAVYLDWAVSKDNNTHALGFLGTLLGFLSNGPPDRLALPSDVPFAVQHSREPGVTRVEVAIAFTHSMLCRPSFRPRRVIVSMMYPTFWALWNEMVVQVGEHEPDTVESLVDDLMTQVEYYDQHGVAAGRGGRAHLVAGQVGAGRRLAAEIAEWAGMSAEEFRALPEQERDVIIEAYSSLPDDIERG